MPRREKAKKNEQKTIESYAHLDKQRLNNPPVGLVTPETDPDGGKRIYSYDPHLDPQLVWAGKAERTSFEVPTVSLHVHERINPLTIIEAVRKWNDYSTVQQLSLFETPQENPPLREAIEFYKHKHGWSNRLILGDSLLVMNSLLEKEGMGGQVQMIYIDPPYGIKYNSNFQPFVNKRDVKDGRDEDLTQEPEMIKAFRDTWELGIHSYLTCLRDRLLLSRELLHESGSIFVQINDENLHLVRCLLDEVFGRENFVSVITFRTAMTKPTILINNVGDFLLWYCKDKSIMKFRPLFVENPSASGFRTQQLEASTLQTRYEFVFRGKVYNPGNGWRVSKDSLERLVKAERVYQSGTLRYIRYDSDFPYFQLDNLWIEQLSEQNKVYAVQTNTKVVERCLLMTTDPGDLVFDPTCGSGTTAYVAEKWGRRWITCDTSRVAIALAKQRLMTAVFDYYELALPEEGVGSGFKYKTVPHITLKAIANNPDIDVIHARWQERLEPIRTELNKVLGQSWEEWQVPREPEATWPERAKELLAKWWQLRHQRQKEIDAAIARYGDSEILYDQPIVDHSKVRVTGPFTVEAVPAPVVKSIDEVAAAMENDHSSDADMSVARTGETARQRQWRDELLKTGIRGKGGQRIEFSRVEPLAGTRYLHAEAETKGEIPERVVISFGPEYAPLEQRQVEQAIEEAQKLVPRPKFIVFAAFEFDPEAAKDIDETKWPGVTLLKVKMNADLLTEDLKKKRASNDSFWLIGQPDVELRRITKGPHKGEWEVEVRGFDYFDTRTGKLVSGGPHNIAMWLLDPDYDGRSLYPRQVFFPMAGEKGGWAKLARTLRTEIDEELIEQYRGTVSLPFKLGAHRRVAVKIVDDRGIESMKILRVDA